MSSSHVSADLRQVVRNRARERCEYCGLPERLSFAGHEVEHIIARKHRGETEPGNLALACAIWNKHTRGATWLPLIPSLRS